MINIRLLRSYNAEELSVLYNAVISASCELQDLCADIPVCKGCKYESLCNDLATLDLDLSTIIREKEGE